MGSDLLLVIVFYVEKSKSIINVACKLDTSDIDADDFIEINQGIMNEAFFNALPKWWNDDDFYKNPVKIIPLFTVEGF